KGQITHGKIKRHLEGGIEKIPQGRARQKSRDPNGRSQDRLQRPHELLLPQSLGEGGEAGCLIGGKGDPNQNKWKIISPVGFQLRVGGRVKRLGHKVKGSGVKKNAHDVQQKSKPVAERLPDVPKEKGLEGSKIHLIR